MRSVAVTGILAVSLAVCSQRPPDGVRLTEPCNPKIACPPLTKTAAAGGGALTAAEFGNLDRQKIDNDDRQDWKLDEFTDANGVKREVWCINRDGPADGDDLQSLRDDVSNKGGHPDSEFIYAVTFPGSPPDTRYVGGCFLPAGQNHIKKVFVDVNADGTFTPGQDELLAFIAQNADKASDATKIFLFEFDIFNKDLVVTAQKADAPSREWKKSVDKAPKTIDGLRKLMQNLGDPPGHACVASAGEINLLHRPYGRH